MVWCFKLLSWMCTCLIVLKLHFVLIFFDTALPPTLSLDRTTRPNYWLSRPTNSCGTEHDSVGVFDLAGFIMQAQINRINLAVQMTSAPSVTRSTPSLHSLSAARKCNSRHQLHDSSQQLDWHCRWSVRLPIHIPSSRFGWHQSCQRSAQHQLHDPSQQLHQRSCKTPGGFSVLSPASCKTLGGVSTPL